MQSNSDSHGQHQICLEREIKKNREKERERVRESERELVGFNEFYDMQSDSDNQIYCL